MTVLNFLLQEDVVHVLTDTVASDPVDLKPSLLISKIYLLPHLDMMICGTGFGRMVLEWFATVNSRVIVADIEHLDAFAPDELKRMFETYEGSIPSEKMTCTIYHFGHSKDDDKIGGFAYRSVNHFASERLPYGIVMKPAPAEPFDVAALSKSFIELAELQKIEGEVSRLCDRVGIGGELLFASMMRYEGQDGASEIVTQIQKCHQFADFDDAYLSALQKNGLA
jgi:hypothetical protein